MLSSHVFCDWKEFMAALRKLLQHSAFNCTKPIDDLWPSLSRGVYSPSTYFSVHRQIDNKKKCTFASVWMHIYTFYCLDLVGIKAQRCIFQILFFNANSPGRSIAAFHFSHIQLNDLTVASGIF